MIFCIKRAARIFFGACVLLSVSLAGANAQEQPKYHVSSGLVIADWNGQTYEISAPEWADSYPYKSIVVQADLDNDGLQDAVISLGTGGNCCPTEFAVVTPREAGFFAIATHPDFASWQDPEILATPQGVVLTIRVASDGVGNTSLEEVLVKFRLQDGQLEEISTQKNSAMLFSEQTLTSKALVESGQDYIALSAMLDGDNVADEIACNYWERWGALMCTVNSSKFGRIETNTGCDRIGVLKHRTNGLKDLVCGRNGLLIFDGQRYTTGN